MTESNRASTFREARTPFFTVGVTACDAILCAAGISRPSRSLPDFLTRRPLQRLTLSFQSESTLLKASRSGIVRACFFGIPNPLSKPTLASGRCIGPWETPWRLCVPRMGRLHVSSRRPKASSADRHPASARELAVLFILLTLARSS